MSTKIEHVPGQTARCAASCRMAYLRRCLGFLLFASALVAGASLAVADPIGAIVIDGETTAPIAGATVTAGDVAVTTDAAGAFALPDGDAAVAVTVAAPGYDPTTELIAPVAGPDRPFVLLFHPGALGEVIEVEGRGPRAGAGLAATTLLDRDEIRHLPGGGSDALAAVRSLPGVGSATAAAGGRLVIRGSAPEDSRLTIDGVPVPFIYHTFNNATILPVGMIGAIAYAPGGFGVEEGRATGGVVGITTVDTIATEVAGEASLSMTEVSADVHAPLSREHHVSIEAGLRRSTVDLLIPIAVPDDVMIGFTTAPRYYDGQLRVDWQPTPRDRVAVLALTSYDRLALINHDTTSDLPSEFSTVGRFGRVIASWKRDGDRVDNRLVGALGADGFDVELGLERDVHGTEAIAMVRDDAAIGLGEVATLRLGGEASIEQHHVTARSFLLPTEGLPPERLDQLPIRMVDASYDSNLAAAYAALDLTADEHLTVTTGIRAEYYGHLRRTRALPRVQARWRQGPITITGALGLYARDLDQAEGIPTDLMPEAATQVTGGVEVAVADGVTASVGGFATARSDLVVEDPTRDGPDQLPFVTGGHGRSRGAEVLLRLRRGGVFGWIAYTYARADRDDGPLTPTRPFAFDQPHNLTAVVSAVHGPWRFGARWQFASGLPYTEVVGATYVAEVDRWVPTLGPPLAARYPTNHQLDLRLERVWQRKGWRLVGYVDVSNTYRNERVVRYQYDPTYTERKPIADLIPLPSIGVRAEL